MKTLIAVRHGNTFRRGETPTRVGARTDLPLVEKERGHAIGRHLAAIGLIPDRVLAAPLLRTMETARLAVGELGVARDVTPIEAFREIDYGPDENQPEEHVIARIGQAAIDAWNRDALVPPGWLVDTVAIIDAWRQLAATIADGERVLLVTSNGILRFAPYILAGSPDASSGNGSDPACCSGSSYAEFCATHDMKVATGHLCIFTGSGMGWRCDTWNRKPG
jgi:Fructose-2,6-bisphosphatase